MVSVLKLDDYNEEKEIDFELDFLASKTIQREISDDVHKNKGDG